MIRLTSGEVIDCAQISDTDCSDSPDARFVMFSRDDLEGSAEQGMAIYEENHAKLLSTPVEKIRVYGTDGYLDFMPNENLNPKESMMIIAHLQSVK